MRRFVILFLCAALLGGCAGSGQAAVTPAASRWDIPATPEPSFQEKDGWDEAFADEFEKRCQQALYGIDATLDHFADSPRREKFMAKILGWKKLDYRDEYELAIDRVEWREGSPEPSLPDYGNKEEKEEQIRIYSSPYVFLSNWYTPMEFGEFCGNLGKGEFANGYDGEHVYTFYQYENEWGQMETAFLVGIYLP